MSDFQASLCSVFLGFFTEKGASRPGNVPLLLMVVIVLALPCAAVMRQVDVVKSASCRYSYWIEAKEGFHASTCHTSIDALESTRKCWGKVVVVCVWGGGGGGV